MNIYEIRVTNENDANDFATTSYVSQEVEKSPEEIIRLVEKAINYRTELEFQCGGKFITISACSDDEGYYYDTYESREAYENGEESEDGGQCTGTINDALNMALN